MNHEMDSIYIRDIPLFRIMYLPLKFVKLWHFKVHVILSTELHLHSHYTEYNVEPKKIWMHIKS